MGREKQRKSRLNKGESGEFIGFGAFAAPAPALTPSSNKSTLASPAPLTLSPVYIGSDATSSSPSSTSAGAISSSLSILFQRIGQKRDSTTKTKALLELKDFFADESHPKKIQVDALSHFLYLYHTKLNYDSTASVRAASLECCTQASTRVPKAWKTLCYEQQPELVGMMWCARADPAADVRLAATKLSLGIENTTTTNATKGEDENKNDNMDTAEAEKGLWDYAQRITSYGKAMAMHEDLFQKKSVAGETSSNKLSERQQEELEERFERILGTTLGGVRLFLLHKNNNSNNNNIPEDLKFLWKTMSSPKASIRHKTYLLLSAACQKIPNNIDQEKISKMLSQSLSSEKDASNIPALLETLLSFVAAQPALERTKTIEVYTKPLTKLFKRGCYGATQWGPTVLPIVALLPQDEQPNVLTSVWEGRANLVGVADSLQIVQAVAETATFLLTQKPHHDLAEVTAKCWIQSLQTYLSTNASGAAFRAQEELCTALAKDMNQLNIATNNKPNSSICHLKDWFWKEELPKCISSNTESQNVRLSALLRKIQKIVEESSAKINDNNLDKTNRRAHYTLALKEKFHALLGKCQGSSGLVPTPDAYELWIAILDHMSICDFFADTKQLGHFVMNDLLRWMIIHTSSLSDQANDALTKYDFTMFWHCYIALSSFTTPTTTTLDRDESGNGKNSNREIWDAVLREIIAAKCDLQYLMVGLEHMSRLIQKQQNSGYRLDLLKSNALDKLCIEVAKEAVEPHQVDPAAEHHDDEVESISHASSEMHMEYHRKTSDFLQTCVGLGDIEDFLVEQATVQTWVDLACPQDSLQIMEHSPVLETLVALAQNDKLTEKDIDRTSVQCWRQGDDSWQHGIQHWLLKKPDSAARFIGLASKELNSTIRQISSEAKFDGHLPELWARRAFRLLEFCENYPSTADASYSLSLTLVGLADLSLWERKEMEGDASFIALSLMILMSYIEDEAKRWKLISESKVQDINGLLVRMLINLSSASDTDIVKASRARRRRDSCAELLTKLGGRDIDCSLVDSWCRKCVSMLASAMGDKTSKAGTCRGIAVLSQLLGLMFRTLEPSPEEPEQDDVLIADQIKKGDALWYITNIQEPNKREPCTVVKIHTDLPEELYFTIETKHDGESQERQTVLSRLRQNDYTVKTTNLAPVANDDSISVSAIQSDEFAKREIISQFIYEELVKPFWDTWSTLDYEILNILIAHCGLLGDRGIGTTHFTVFQKLVSMQSALRGYFVSATKHKTEIVSSLHHLSLSLGYGWNTSPSRGALSILGFSPADSLGLIAEYYDQTEPGLDPEIDQAVASWLAVAGRDIGNAELRDRIHSLMFRIAAHIFESCKELDSFAPADLIAMRAIHAAQVKSHEISTPGGSVVQDDEAEAIKEIVGAFASRWENSNNNFEGNHDDNELQAPVWCSLPVVDSVLKSSLAHRSALVAAATRCCADSVVSCLCHDTKRSISLQLIQAYTNEGIPLHAEADGSINEETAKRMKGWSQGLVVEEAEELEEDVGVVAQWIPRQLMNYVESWHSDDKSSASLVSDNDAFNRMALWLAFLDIADLAARKGTLIRPALTSYIRHCKSADAMLDLAIVYGNAGSDGKVKLDTTVPDIEKLFHMTDRSTMELTKIAASSVIFRTVEVLPTISKTWWEVACPSYCLQAVKEFVESTVSPQILRHELNRMKRYSSFGEMNVRGSAVSREVTAMYLQDDFTLTVVIKLPPSFPFGRAEVDCSKTLGVPEQRSKRWSLQISLMLNNQGGTLIDALILWKENVDKEFEGVEPCPVCYSVLHVKTHKLPEMQCKTCSNRFHFDCLTQWFRSSGKNACVLCQQPWSGTRIT